MKLKIPREAEGGARQRLTATLTDTHTYIQTAKNYKTKIPQRKRTEEQPHILESYRKPLNT